ncbi:hypothetical protein GCM10020366_35220 [Saccharopolyspora gregorii]|uniref:Uncharacterized protein n=1 Tax=Saccharopolyspora gregorii TaxID=33914 RepID=A0ABP6RTA8_9PSEU
MRAADLTSRTPFCPSAMPLIPRSPRPENPRPPCLFRKATPYTPGGRRAVEGSAAPGVRRESARGPGQRAAADRRLPIRVASPAASNEAADSP